MLRLFLYHDLIKLGDTNQSETKIIVFGRRVIAVSISHPSSITFGTSSSATVNPIGPFSVPLGSRMCFLPYKLCPINVSSPSAPLLYPNTTPTHFHSCRISRSRWLSFADDRLRLFITVAIMPAYFAYLIATRIICRFSAPCTILPFGLCRQTPAVLLKSRYLTSPFMISYTASSPQRSLRSLANFTAPNQATCSTG